MKPKKFENFALIIGTGKAGTTSLFYYLSQHPAMSPSFSKEPSFFAFDEEFSKGLAYYEDMFEKGPEHIYAMDGSTNYTRIPFAENAAEKIAKVDANFKLIYILRHPIERIESQHHQFLARGIINKPVTEEISNHILEATMYARQIDEYYKRFDKDRILILKYEDFKQDELSILLKVCDFLGIDSSFPFETGTKHNTKKAALGEYSPVWSSLRNITPLRRIVKKTLSQDLKDKMKVFLGKSTQSGKISPEAYTLTPAQVEEVYKKLKPDHLRLRDEYGFDISGWGIEES